MPLDEVDNLLHLPEPPLSLDVPLEVDDRHTLADTLEDPRSEAPADFVIRHLLSEELQRALAQLTIRERSVVLLRCGIADGHDGHSRTLLEVGKELGITRERAHQLEVVALTKLRHALSKSRTATHQQQLGM